MPKTTEMAIRFLRQELGRKVTRHTGMWGKEKYILFTAYGSLAQGLEFINRTGAKKMTDRYGNWTYCLVEHTDPGAIGARPLAYVVRLHVLHYSK